MSASSASDVRSRAPRYLKELLGLPGRVAVLERDDATQRSGSNATRIELSAGETHVGAMVFESPSADDPPLDVRRVELVTELLARTLARLAAVENEQLRMVKEAAELRFDVVSMLSHEMRTPLASIKGYASALLLDDVTWDADTQEEFLQSIEAEADHLTKLVTDILEATAIDAGDLRLELEPVLIARIAKRVIDKVAIHGAGHRFALMFPSDFPVVEADAHRLEQVLTNLVDNAVKYSPDGGMVLLRGEAGAGEVVVSVVDQGMGIAPEHLNKLFERFFRALPDHRRRIVGTGLGLPIADAIVRAHGGRIWASSVVGSGTTLSFSLPHPRPVAGKART
ncbi:MAG TPA: ATP-binding protein [Thermomicrobiales bacterium]|nr:ATP-binding protein [Thermomicrobiales bacterium]